MTPDVGILTNLFNSFSGAFANGIGFIHSDARWLLGTLIILDLILAVLLNLSDGDHMKTLITKTLKYGLFIWLVTDYKSLVNMVIDSFEMIGLKAGGGGIARALLTDPSALADEGILVTAPIFEHIANISGLDVIPNLPDIIFTGLMGILIVFSFFIIGIQIFVTYLEFYVVGTLALILLPFGVFRHTAFLGEKAIGAVLSFGIKLMVLSFIASVSVPLIRQWALPVDPTLKQCMCLLLGSSALTFLAWQAPGVASGLLSGHPTLSAGSGAGFALAGGAAAFGAGYAGSAAARKMYETAKAAANAGGQLTGAARTAGMSGVSTLAVDKASNMGRGVRNAFSSGFEHGSTVASGEGKGDGGGSTSGESPSRPPGAQDVMHRLNYVRNSVPPESHHGGGSATPNLKGGSES